MSPNLANPVGAGFAASLAHPGGSVTGLSFLGLELDGKRLELLRETTPRATRVAFLADSASMMSTPWIRDTVQALGVQLQGLVVQAPDDFDPAFRDATGGQAQALLVSVGAIFQLHRTRVLDFAAHQRLPAMYPVTEFVEDGGLMCYGPNQSNQFHRAAWYVDKILKGTDPAVLPIEQPTKFDFAINLKTAQALGLSIPPSVLQQATEVIQ